MKPKENYENKDKAELILAQIQDKIRSKIIKFLICFLVRIVF